MVDQEPHNEPTRADTPIVDEPTMAMAAPGEAPPPVDRPPTGEPPAPPPDRGPWILVGILALIAVVAITALLVGGDDDDEAATAESTTTTEETTTTSEETTTTSEETTTTTAPTTTTTEATPTTIDPARCSSSPPEDPAPTAIVFYDAYTVGDRDCASKVGTASAVDALFDIFGAGGGWTFQGCDEQTDPDPHFLCAYSFDGGSTAFRLNFGAVDGWMIYEVFQTAD